jgi:acyl carrier protein
VRIPDEDAAKLMTVGQSADYVASRLEQSGAQA